MPVVPLGTAATIDAARWWAGNESTQGITAGALGAAAGRAACTSCAGRAGPGPVDVGGKVTLVTRPAGIVRLAGWGTAGAFWPSTARAAVAARQDGPGHAAAPDSRNAGLPAMRPITTRPEAATAPRDIPTRPRTRLDPLCFNIYLPPGTVRCDVGPASDRAALSPLHSADKKSKNLV